MFAPPVQPHRALTTHKLLYDTLKIEWKLKLTVLKQEFDKLSRELTSTPETESGAA